MLIRGKKNRTAKKQETGPYSRNLGTGDGKMAQQVQELSAKAWGPELGTSPCQKARCGSMHLSPLHSCRDYRQRQENCSEIRGVWQKPGVCSIMKTTRDSKERKKHLSNSGLWPSPHASYTQTHRILIIKITKPEHSHHSSYFKTLMSSQRIAHFSNTSN